MLSIRDHEPLAPKTTMRIGGTARYFAEIATKKDTEEAYEFAQKNHLPLIVLGSGSNTIFADGEINALVVRIAAQEIKRNPQPATCNLQSVTLTVASGKNLPMFINELAKEGLDLSPLTGIPGTIGGAIFGNAGQGPKGIWIDHFVESVMIFADGKWQTLSKDDCTFAYRESVFKHSHAKCSMFNSPCSISPIIWSATLTIPRNDLASIKTEIECLLKKRIETQPHQRTAGSCFKAVGEAPAWQLIHAAGLRGMKHGGVQISKKHANFLVSEKGATFEDATNVVNVVKKKIPQDLEVEMRFIKPNGSLAY